MAVETLTELETSETPASGPEPEPPEPTGLARIWADMVAAGWREAALRYASHGLVLALLGAVIWIGRWNLNFLDRIAAKAALDQLALTATPVIASEAIISDTIIAPPPVSAELILPPETGAVSRLADMHTLIPTGGRFDVITYTVEAGDTLFGIAENFHLKPETVLWGNYFTLKDDPHTLRPGQVLNILPVDGTYHFVTEGNTVEQIAKFYKVDVQVIVDWAPNKVDPQTLALPANTWLVVPGGQRELQVWSVPTIDRTTTSNRANNFGQCPGGYSGAIGSGTFVWPANRHYLSGYDYSAIHHGIDIKAEVGDPIYAADGGVIVYAGWNDFGYGNLVVIDHGNGWQSVYGHLSQIYVVCGQSVGQGIGLGLAGSTGRSSGPHLHFELRYAGSYVNPWDMLP